MNSVNLVGRLTRAPTVRFEGDSHQTATFTLAVQEPSREGKPYVLYVPCTSWGKSAEACALLSAEDLISVHGRLTWRQAHGRLWRGAQSACRAGAAGRRARPSGPGG